MATILIRGARQLLTLRGSQGPRRGAELNQLSIIPDGSLLVRDGVLEQVGTTRRVENLAATHQAMEINAAGRVVMPGFVDSHTHLLFPVPGAPAGTPDTAVRALRATTNMRLKMSARVYLQAMARHGTTTVEVKTGCGPDEQAERKILRVAAELGEGPLDIVTTFLLRGPWIPLVAGEESNEGWKPMRSEFLPNVQRRNLIRFADIEWDQLSANFWKARPDWRMWIDGFFQVARSLGLGRKVHAESTSVTTAIGIALQHHAASIDHIEHATPEDAAMLAEGDTVATLLPCSSFHGGGPYAPARTLVDAGVPIAIATNFNAHHTPSLSMQAAISLACRRMGLTAAEAIAAATINGAHAIRRAARIGSLECGKIADVIILAVPDYRELATSLGTNLVHLVMKRGEVIYEQGGVGPLSTDELRPAY